MIKSELVDRLFKSNPRLYREDVEKAVNAIFYEIGSALERGDRVEIRGFGAFTTRIRMARTFRNPLTESLVRVKSKRLPHFKMQDHRPVRQFRQIRFSFCGASAAEGRFASFSGSPNVFICGCCVDALGAVLKDRR